MYSGPRLPCSLQRRGTCALQIPGADAATACASRRVALREEARRRHPCRRRRCERELPVQRAPLLRVVRQPQPLAQRAARAVARVAPRTVRAAPARVVAPDGTRHSESQFYRCEVRQHMVLVASEPISAGGEIRIDYEGGSSRAGSGSTAYWGAETGMGEPREDGAWRAVRRHPPPPPATCEAVVAGCRHTLICAPLHRVRLWTGCG